MRTSTPGLADAAAELAQAARRLARAGLVNASGGNLSARLAGNLLAVTAAGSWFDMLSEADVLAVDSEGTVVEGRGAPTSELNLHLAAYRARPDVAAVVHVHPPLSVLLDALGHEIRLITTDHAAYVGRIVSEPYRASGSTALADAAASALADGTQCVLLGHHGCAVVGDSVEAATRRVLNLEDAAVATYRALLLGDAQTRIPEAFWSRELHHPGG